MKDVFSPDRINYILRTYLPPWNFETRIAEIVEYCKLTDTRHVMLFTDAQHMVWNQLTLDDAREEAANVRRAREYLANEGIRVGTQISYNMRKARTDHRDRMDYDYWATGNDGLCDFRTPCLLDPKLETYLRAFLTIVAESGADYLYIDDDHRYIMAHEDAWGCMCDLHLQTFSDVTGMQWTRENLMAALHGEQTGDVRVQWVDFLGERLIVLGKLMADAVHAVDPEMKVGMMVPVTHMLAPVGHTITNVLETFTPRGKPLVRPSICPYSDHNRRQIFSALFHTEFVGHLLGNDVEYTPELETSPYTRYSKSMAVNRFEIAQGILNRMNNPALSVNGCLGDSPFIEPAFPEMLTDSRGFFERLRMLAPARGTRKGIQLFWDSASARLSRRAINRYWDLIWPAFVVHEILGSMGFAVTYDDSPGRLLAGESVRALGDDEIRDILSGGVILEYHAARALADMGYGELIGCEPGGRLDRFAAELCVDPDFCGPYVGTYITLKNAALTSVYQLTPAEGAFAISNITDFDRHEIGAGTVLYENSLGGKVAVLPIAMLGSDGDLRHMICYQRRHMFKTIVDWMAPDALGAWVEEPMEIGVQVWDDGDRLTCCFTNLSFDVADAFTVALQPPALSPANAVFVADDGSLQPLSNSIDVLESEAGTRWGIRKAMLPWRPLVMVVERRGEEGR